MKKAGGAPSRETTTEAEEGTRSNYTTQSMYSVYFLTVDGLVKYVGASKFPHERYAHHARVNAEHSPQLAIVRTGLSRADAYRLEVHYIELAGGVSRLWNITAGGDRGPVLSEMLDESRARALDGRYRGGKKLAEMRRMDPELNARCTRKPVTR